jgi:hypothetical protein
MMNKWFRSRNGALILSLLAAVSLLARSYYDIRFILVEEFSALWSGMDALWIACFTLIIGLNMAFLVGAARDRRGSWIGLLVFNLVTGLGSGAASLVVYLSNTFELVVFSLCLVSGLLAASSVGLLLRQKP